MRHNSNRNVSRRTVLRAAGIALSLPLLESLARGAAAPATKDEQLLQKCGRLVCIYTPHGVCNEQWYPQQFGEAFPDTPSLQPLQELRQQATFFSGLSHLQSAEGLGHSGVDVWLTGRDPHSPKEISLDQVVAEKLQTATRVPSLQLGTRSGTGSSQAAFTLSYNKQGMGLPTENDPRRVFGRLFLAEDENSRELAAQRLADRRSILDSVHGQSQDLSRRLSKADQQKFAEYLQSIRDVELRLERSRSWLDKPKPAVNNAALNLDVRIRENKTDFLQTMYELAALALETDSTRVVTLVTAPEGNNSDAWPELGLTGIHHGLQHHNGKASTLAKFAEVDRMEVGLLAGFLKRLQSSNQQGETLLDRTLVLYGSGMNNGAGYANGGGSHGTRKLPTLLAGGGKLGLQHGRHLDFPNDRTPLANVFVSLMQAIGIERDSFADSTGTLTGLS